MVNDSYKAKVKNVISQAKKKGKIITYNDYCKAKNSSEYALLKEDIDYYISNEEEKK